MIPGVYLFCIFFAMTILARLLMLSVVALLSGCVQFVPEDADLTISEDDVAQVYEVIEGAEPAAEEQVEELEQKIGDRVFFALASSELSSEARAVLEQQAKFMMENTDVYFVIEGHCDERGTQEFNLALGERRANAVVQYLMSLGVERARLTAISYGKQRPEVLGANEWAWSQNRRAVTTPR